MSSDNPLVDNVKTSVPEDSQEAAPAQQADTSAETPAAAPAPQVTESPTRPEAAPAGAAPTAESPTAESTGGESPAPAASQPVEEAASQTPVDANDSAPPSQEPASTPASAPAGRLRLRPKVLDEESTRAIPTVASGAPVQADEVTAPALPANEGAADASGADSDKPRDEEQAPPKPRPVELPSKEIDLDADLEAQIEAAVKADESETAATVEQQQSDDESEVPDEDALAPGAKIKGKVQSLHGDNVFFEIGGRSPGVVSARQFLTDKPPAVGDEFNLVVERVDEAEGLVVLSLPRGKRSIGGNWDAVSKGQVVDCMVTKTNKGGLEVTVSSLRGFMPASQVDLNYVDDLEVYVGQKLRAVITEANPRKRNLIVSRRAYLDIERKEAARELWKSLAEGQQFTGTVKTLKDYGAFVDIGGIDGFLHVGEISWTRLNHPSDVLSAGQTVEVQIIKLDRDKNRISLGMKQLKPDPWTVASVNYPVGSAVTGRVTRAMDFGAFVELEPGVEGLIHISELDYKRVNKVTDVVNVEQEVEAKVLEVDQDRRRIGLSIKQLQEKPPELQSSSAAGDNHHAADDLPPVERKRKGPLKGGTGPEKSGGGLFGNPNDFT